MQIFCATKGCFKNVVLSEHCVVERKIYLEDELQQVDVRKFCMKCSQRMLNELRQESFKEEIIFNDESTITINRGEE